jgi:putative restriction endonuclease
MSGCSGDDSVKAVFDTRAGSGYDDDITHRYHFPDSYLQKAAAAVGDWVIYREPRRGRNGYIAVAMLERLEVDPVMPRHHYAIMSNYLSFDALVPYRMPGGLWEQPLQDIGNPRLLGAYLQGRSVRPLSDGDFGAIVRAGLEETLDPENAVRLHLTSASLDADAGALLAEPRMVQERRIERVLLNRKIRDAAFRNAVMSAYDSRCAVTRLRIVNGGGRAEAQAAHIWPVADGGPDVVQNGTALSSTAHWLFDRHLISLNDDFSLLVSHNKVPPEFQSLLSSAMQRIHLPKSQNQWPDIAYVRRHRETFAGH